LEEANEVICLPVFVHLHNSSQIPDQALLEGLMLNLGQARQSLKILFPDDWAEVWNQQVDQMGTAAAMETGVDYCGLGPDGEMMFRMYTAT